MYRLRTFGGLWIENQDGSLRDGVRPRQRALLALLASAGTKGLSRDRVLAVLWPESNDERARHALSQTVYSLRADLDADVVLATPSDLRLDSSALTSDLDDFKHAIAAKKWQRAALLYQGPFLDAFYLNDAPEFELWVEDERARLTQEGVRAIERAARAADEATQLEEAAVQWQRLTELDPLSAEYALACMAARARLGDRLAAITHGQAHVERVRRELETDPDERVTALIGRLREEKPSRRTAEPETLAPVSSAADATQSEVRASATPATRRSRGDPRWILAAAIVLTLSAGAILWRARDEPVAPVLAVGQIRDLITPDSARLAGVLSEMFATSIGRLTDLHVIANSRILELLPSGVDTAQRARSDAARRAGATEVLEGEIMALPGQGLRLELRRVDLRRGLVRGAYRIDGRDRVAVFDSATVLLAADLRVPRPTGSLTQMSTASPIAYRLYEEGLRAYSQHDARSALRLFTAAIAEDSMFAMAHYYAWLSEIAAGVVSANIPPDRMLALAARAHDRDRLLIRTHVGGTYGDSAVPILAESLATRFPNDPEALMRAGQVVPELSRAIQLVNRSIAIDSAAGVTQGAICRLCEALAALVGEYVWADSSDAVFRTLERWRRMRPADFTPWAVLADYSVGIGSRSQADSAHRRAIALGMPTTDDDDVIRSMVWAVRSDDLVRADQLCRVYLAARDSLAPRMRWYCTIALRMQGRFREAHALAHGPAIAGADGPRDAVHAAILEMEMGQPRAAASRFLDLARQREVYYARIPGRQAANVTWNLTLAGTAFALAGDTARVRALIDSVAATGRRSPSPRDPPLHHFLHGLILARANNHQAAVQAFQAAMHAPALGYTRINYELGKSLLALRRASEAIPILRAPLRGGIEGAGLYLTRTDAHELLARAFDNAGQRDSALAHYAIVERSWQNADPEIAQQQAAV